MRFKICILHNVNPIDLALLKIGIMKNNNQTSASEKHKNIYHLNGDEGCEISWFQAISSQYWNIINENKNKVSIIFANIINQGLT
ncbi:hypothetical protein [Mycoplasmopsis opalescens]|uniref:hypothetical protein n=1 Tax=Mycoplasmopsis opalescens TaxID=114886 RepID=UPI0012EC3185|nr:hypothetical protein [Mycoplasmopsis opalescens]